MLTVLLPLIAPALLDSTCSAPPRIPSTFAPSCAAALRSPSDTTRPRRRAVELSDGYATRLTIHRYASYTLPPLFVAQYVLGTRLIHQKEDLFAGRRRGPIDGGLRTAHVATAVGVGTLFAVNTVTGLWNLRESRRQPEGRGLRTTHAALMLAADAGFAATGVIGRQAYRSDVARARAHRAVAVSSMSVATVAASLMWLRR